MKNAKIIFKRKTVLFLLVMLWCLLPGGSSKAAERVFDIVVKDGYTTQTIPMLYGKTPYGYTGYYAKESVILVHPKAKNVRFSVKNESGRYTNFSFQQSTMEPTEDARYNMLSYYTDGRRRAFLFSVRKTKAPVITSYKLFVNGKSTNQFLPGNGSCMAVRWACSYDVAPSMKVEILNKSGKAVFVKEYARAKNYQSCTLKWRGMTSMKNPAGLKSYRVLTPGVYTMKLTLTSKVGKTSLSTVQSKRIRILKDTKTK